MKKITITHEYPVPPETLWAFVTDYDCLEKVMTGIVEFTGTPTGRLQAGQKMNIEVSLFGRLPKQPYYMEIVSCDDINMCAQSNERGAGVKVWAHTMKVEKTDSGSRLIDTIDIDAGIMTPLFVLWARYLYKGRHKPRLKLLGVAT